MNTRFAFASLAVAVDNGLSNAPGIDLTIQSLYGILVGLVCWATQFILVFMVLVIVWYGIQFLTAQANPTKFKDALTGMRRALIGIAIILGTYTIIATIGNVISGATTGTAAWRNYVPISCSGIGGGGTYTNTVNKGTPGDACRSNSDCSTGFKCSKNHICQYPNGNIVGSPCSVTGDCQKGLTCDFTQSEIRGNWQLGKCARP